MSTTRGFTTVCLLALWCLTMGPVSADPPKILDLPPNERNAIERALNRVHQHDVTIWRFRAPDWGPRDPGVDRVVWVDLTPDHFVGRIAYYDSLPCIQSSDDDGTWQCNSSRSRQLMQVRR